MTHLGLLQSQKNEIFDFLVQHGFNPGDFAVTDWADKTNILYLKDKRFYCAIAVTNNHYHNEVAVAPGTKTLNQSFHPRTGQWDDYRPIIQQWAENLKKETSTIDKWTELSDKSSSVISFTFSGKEQFTEAEKITVKERLRELRGRIKELPIDKSKLESIDKKLDDLTNKVDKLNKTNWFELFVGAIIGQILSLSIPAEVAKQIWDLIKVTFGSYIQIGTP